jgi:hypothetical protein
MLIQFVPSVIGLSMHGYRLGLNGGLNTIEMESEGITDFQEGDRTRSEARIESTMEFGSQFARFATSQIDNPFARPSRRTRAR